MTQYEFGNGRSARGHIEQYLHIYKMQVETGNR
jgi:hypothetical protein